MNPLLKLWRRILNNDESNPNKYPHRFIKGVDYKVVPGGYELLREYVHNRKMLKYSKGISFGILYACIESDGTLVLERGYRWDGPSGPAADTKDFMRGSAVHDAFYAMMRVSALKQSDRKEADAEMRRTNTEDGMFPIRSWWTWAGVRHGAAYAAKVKPNGSD